MGSVASENGVLKLVHPGRFVEILKKPITAAEVLQKYPRHSVTRPDVFEYPWVVVKPESVLNLGKVFFIVPNHTIYNLLKAHKEKNQKSPYQSQSSNMNVNKQVQNQYSPLKSHAGSTPKHLNCHRKHLNTSPTTTATSCIWIPSLDRDRESKTRKQNKVGSWPEVMVKLKNTQLRLEEKQVEDSRTKISRSFNHEEDHNIDTDISSEFYKRNYVDLEFNYSKEVTMLKSCLRKPDSVRKSLKLNVSFLLPSKEEEQQRRVKVSREEFAGNYSCSFADFFVHSTSLVPT